MRDRCGDCRFYQVNTNLTSGQCRRNPPATFMVPSPGPGGSVNINFLSSWPGCKSDDGCGEFSPKSLSQRIVEVEAKAEVARKEAE